jgi:hypothetical protein
MNEKQFNRHQREEEAYRTPDNMPETWLETVLVHNLDAGIFQDSRSVKWNVHTVIPLMKIVYSAPDKQNFFRELQA